MDYSDKSCASCNIGLIIYSHIDWYLALSAYILATKNERKPFRSSRDPINARMAESKQDLLS